MKNKLLVLLVLVAGITSAQSVRMCLYEEFTGETCPPCAATNPGLNTLLANNASKVIPLKWQVPIPSAPTKTWSLYQTNKTEINWRYAQYGYGINSAPSGRMDGQSVTAFGASSDHPANMNSTHISNAQAIPAAFDITMTRAWNKSCTAVNLTITVLATANFTSTGNFYFRTVMVERLIQFSVQPGTNGETTFEDVVIKSFPTHIGTSMQKNWTAGQSMTFTLSCPVPSYTRKKSEIAMVGFLQDDGNRRVAQAYRTSTDVVPAESVGMMGAQVEATCNSTISPVVTIKNTGTQPITNMTIIPTVDGNNVTPFVWTGNLPAGTSTNITIPAVPSGTAPGGHMFVYDIDLSASPYNLTYSLNSVAYLVASSTQNSPVAEGFVSTSFPPTGWTAINPDAGPSWLRVTNTGGYSNSYNSVKYDFYNNPVVGDKDELILPPMDLSGLEAPLMSFDLAYTQRTSASNDQLEVLASTDCGQSWVPVWSATGTNMSNPNVAPQTNAYTPYNDYEWRSESFNLPGMNKSHVLVKFVATNDKGNNLFLDNINLSQPVTGIRESALSEGMNVYPNPATGLTNITVQGVGATTLKIKVMSMTGQVVIEKSAQTFAGENRFEIDVKSLSAGIYIVCVECSEGTAVRKLNVIH